MDVARLVEEAVIVVIGKLLQILTVILHHRDPDTDVMDAAFRIRIRVHGAVDECQVQRFFLAAVAILGICGDRQRQAVASEGCGAADAGHVVIHDAAHLGAGRNDVPEAAVRFCERRLPCKDRDRFAALFLPVDLKIRVHTAAAGIKRISDFCFGRNPASALDQVGRLDTVAEFSPLLDRPGPLDPTTSRTKPPPAWGPQ